MVFKSYHRILEGCLIGVSRLQASKGTTWKLKLKWQYSTFKTFLVETVGFLCQFDWKWEILKWYLIWQRKLSALCLFLNFSWESRKIKLSQSSCSDGESWVEGFSYIVKWLLEFILLTKRASPSSQPPIPLSLSFQIFLYVCVCLIFPCSTSPYFIYGLEGYS